MDPFVTASILPSGGRVPGHKPDRRHPAHLVGLKTDPRVEGVLAEVEYKGFAMPHDGIGDPNGGNEREILRLTATLERPQSVGLSMQWEIVDGASLDGLDYGTEWEALQDQSANLDEVLGTLSTEDEKAIRPAIGATKPYDRVFSLARSPGMPGLLIQMVQRLDKRYPADYQNVKEMRAYRIGVFTATEGFKPLLPLVRYHPNGAMLGTVDNEQNPFTSSTPNYLPAAMSVRAGRAWINDSLVSLGRDPNQERLETERLTGGKPPRSIRWLADGTAIRWVFDDGSIGRSAADGTSGLHRFLFPDGARALELSPDGRVRPVAACQRATRRMGARVL